MKVCPKCGTQNADVLLTCSACGGGLPSGPHAQGDATGGIIPYKNPKALLAYYLGILSGLPLIGLPVGVGAFVLGIMGLRDRQKNPVIKGSVHAGIGIGCGCFFSLLWGFAIVMIIIAVVSEQGR